MLAATNNAKWKWAPVEKSERDHVRHFLKFQVIVVEQNNGREMYKKSVLHVQSCFFAN